MQNAYLDSNAGLASFMNDLISVLGELYKWLMNLETFRPYIYIYECYILKIFSQIMITAISIFTPNLPSYIIGIILSWLGASLEIKLIKIINTYSHIDGNIVYILIKLSFGNYFTQQQNCEISCLINIMTYTLCVYKKCLCVYINNFCRCKSNNLHKK